VIAVTILKRNKDRPAKQDRQNMEADTWAGKPPSAGPQTIWFESAASFGKIADVMDPAKAATLMLVLALAGCATGPSHRQVSDWSIESEAAPVTSAPLLVLPPSTNAPGTTAKLPPQSTPLGVDGFRETWIPLQRWAKVNGLEPLSHSILNGVSQYSVKSAQGTFSFQAGSLIARWDGIQVHLGFPPQVIEDQPYLHTLDVRKTLAPLLRGESAASQKPRPVVVLDPGHGGADSGTLSVTGRSEKEFTLDWARRLQRLLVANGWKAYLTRESDVDLPLTNRVAVADKLRADIFLSLHFNSAGDSSTQSGLETYCLTPAGLPSNVTRGYGDSVQQSFPNNNRDTENILLAARLHRALLTGVQGLRDRGVRRARFLGVLRPQQRPAVLLEAGYLSNPEEARQVADPDYRQQLAEVVAQGLIGRTDIAGLRATSAPQRATAGLSSSGALSPER
jgi:N-acetylmuramoyl-L-alanine amidase